MDDDLWVSLLMIYNTLNEPRLPSKVYIKTEYEQLEYYLSSEILGYPHDFHHTIDLDIHYRSELALG